MQPYSTRRFELGLPLFSGLDLGLIAKAQAQIANRDLTGLSAFIGILSDAAAAHTVRKLSAIWRATELELKVAEGDPAVMLALEAGAAERPFAEAFKDALDFVSALWESLGATPASSAPDEPAKVVAEGVENSLSGGSPSGS